MPVRLAVIGCGYWGKNLVRNFNEIGALELVCDPSPHGLATAKRIAPHVECSENVKLALGANIDAVVVATPAETHADVVAAALKAGKDVMVEKPLAINYADGQELVDLADVYDRILMVGHVLEYHPGIQRLIELIREGRLGKLQYIYSNRLSLGKIRREENILWSFAPHDLAVIMRILQDMPLQVVACGGNYVQPNIADMTVTNLLFNNGVRAHIHVSWLHPFKEQRLVVVGSRMMATFDDVTKKLSLYDQRVELKAGEPIPIKCQGEQVPYPDNEPLRLECQAFVEAVSTRKPPLTDGRSGLDVLKVLEAAQRSLMMNGIQVTVPGNGDHIGRNGVIREIRYENLSGMAAGKLNGENAGPNHIAIGHD